MTDKERMEELIFVFSDADRRGRMTEKELEQCPTIGEILDTMGQ